MKSRGRIAIILLGFVIVTPFVAAVLLTQGTRSLKLGDCINNTLPEFQFSCPRGDHYQIVLAFGSVTNFQEFKQPDFGGQLNIKEGRNKIYSIDFSTNRYTYLTWIDNKESIAGYYLTLPDDLPPGQKRLALQNILKPGVVYTLTVLFSNMPPEGSSLWIKWRQNLLGL